MFPKVAEINTSLQNSSKGGAQTDILFDGLPNELVKSFQMFLFPNKKTRVSAHHWFAQPFLWQLALMRAALTISGAYFAEKLVKI